MPGGDGTGPGGMGPMTGRAAGYCAGYSVPGYTNPILGRGGFGFGRGLGRGRSGFGFGRGLGRGRGWAYPAYGYPTFGGQAYPYVPEPTAKEEMGMLKEQADFLKQHLEDIQGRVNTLKKAEAQEKK